MGRVLIKDLFLVCGRFRPAYYGAEFQKARRVLKDTRLEGKNALFFGRSLAPPLASTWIGGCLRFSRVSSTGLPSLGSKPIRALARSFLEREVSGTSGERISFEHTRARVHHAVRSGRSSSAGLH
jgi:hypothetical protein